MSVAVHNDIPIADCFGKSIMLYAANAPLFLLLSFSSTAIVMLNAAIKATVLHGVHLASMILDPVVFLIDLFIGGACLFYVIALRANHEQKPLREVAGYVLLRFSQLAGTVFLFCFMVAAGTFLLIIPGVYCATTFFFSGLAVLLEGKGIKASFERSDELVRGVFWRVLLVHVLVLVNVFVVMVLLLAGMLMMGASVQAVKWVVMPVLALILPVIAAFYYFIYAYLKCSKDGVLNIAVRSS